MAPQTLSAERVNQAAEQTSLDDVLLYTHNAKNAFDEGNPQRIDAYLERLAEVNPDAGFLSEAYLWQHASDEHLQQVLTKFGDLGYKAIAFDYSEYDRDASRPDRHGGIMFARRKMYVGGEIFGLNGQDGRRAIQMTLQTDSGERFVMVGAHANDRPEPRGIETDELRCHYVELHDNGVPVVMIGDFNSDAVSAKKNMLARVLHAGGRLASHSKRLARQAAEQEAGQRNTKVGRLASLAIRSYFQLEGDTIRQLIGEQSPTLISANTEHRPIGHVPKNVPGFVRRALRIMPWLDRPYIESEYIFADEGYSFSGFTRYSRLVGDEHAAISALLHLGELATAA